MSCLFASPSRASAGRDWFPITLKNTAPLPRKGSIYVPGKGGIRSANWTRKYCFPPAQRRKGFADRTLAYHASSISFDGTVVGGIRPDPTRSGRRDPGRYG